MYRELENIIERAVVLTKKGTITKRTCHPFANIAENDKTANQELSGTLNDTLNTIERGLIIEALKGSGGIQTRAAEKLGVSERVFRYKLKKYKIAAE